MRQTPTGPQTYYDQNGVARMIIKKGSARTPGSENPHVSIRDALGRLVDARTGLPTSRRSPANHYAVTLD